MKISKNVRKAIFIAVACLIAISTLPSIAYFAFAGGLAVGWNFLEQPVWVAKVIQRIENYFSDDDENTPTPGV